MKKAWMIRLMLLTAYCIPLAFLSVYGDAVYGTTAYYGVMLFGFAALCWGAIKTKNIAVLCAGNVLSLVVSCALSKVSGLEPMGYYFKPFTSHSLIIAISVAAIVIQIVILGISWHRRERRKK